MKKLEQAARQALEAIGDAVNQALATIQAAIAEQAEQEPVAVVDEIGLCVDGRAIFYAVGKVKVGQKLYAAPVRTKDLTDDELREIHHLDQFGLFCDYDDFEQIARAAIAADREKNK